jgi:hypothetical protein
LATWTIWLLYAYAAITALGIVSDLLQLQLLASRNFSTEEAEANDTRQRISAIVQIVSLAATVIAFSIWTYRANTNIRRLGAEGLRNSPGWSVGWFFVPIALLWKPYQAMKDLWQASAQPSEWRTQPRTAMLPWWWTFWIASVLVGNLAMRMTFAAKTIQDLIGSTVLTLIQGVLSIPAAILLALIVVRIQAMQTQHAYRTV